jgi:hypothetical protein
MSAGPGPGPELIAINLQEVLELRFIEYRFDEAKLKNCNINSRILIS